MPVLRRWERHVAQRAAVVGDRPLFLPQRTATNRRDIANFVARLPRSDAPQLAVSRLRTTWILHHLASGTPFQLLTEVAGIDGAQIGKIGRHLRPLDPSERGSLLRDATP